MDLLQTVIGFCGTVSQTDTEYKLLFQRLNYELQKAEHLQKTQKIKSIPKFMLDNLKSKIRQARQHLQKIQSLLKQNQLSLYIFVKDRKQKIKLSLPFNKTSKQVNAAVQALEKAQQDVLEYSSNQSDSENNNNGKRQVDMAKTKARKDQIMTTIVPSDEVDDDDIDEALMGPTIQEDAAIEFTKNKYVLIQVEICGKPKILNLIKEIDPEFLTYKQKVQIKFQSTEKNDVQYLELFSLGRLHFKPVYGKLRTVWADVDRISKQGHFTIKLKRKWENTAADSEPQMKSQKKEHESAKGNAGDEFYSFPATDQVLVKKQTDVIVLQRAQDKSLFIVDETGSWSKMNEIERELCNGEEIAPWIVPNVNPLVPDLFFKVNFHVLE